MLAGSSHVQHFVLNGYTFTNDPTARATLWVPESGCSEIHRNSKHDFGAGKKIIGPISLLPHFHLQG